MLLGSYAAVAIGSLTNEQIAAAIVGWPYRKSMRLDEEALDEAVRRATTATQRRQMAAYVRVFGIDKRFDRGEYGPYSESRGYGEELSAIRAEYASLVERG